MTMQNQRYWLIAVCASLAACVAEPQATRSSSNSEQPNSSLSVSSQSSSFQSSEPQSFSSSSTVAISSASSATSFTLVLQENVAGVCIVDGDPSEADNAGFTGTGYANVANALNSKITWAIQAPESDTYTVTLRFANGDAENRNGELSINAGSNGAYTIDMPLTGDWAQWQEVSVAVDLVQGNNVLQLSSLTDKGLANVDSLSVEGHQQTLAGDCSGLVNQTPYGDIIGDGRVLAQSGNPAQSRFNSAKTEWAASQADIIVSYQYDNGGWPKNQTYDVYGNGGNDLGTFDNGATITEMVYLAQIYQNTGNTKYRDSVRKAMSFIFAAQYPSGGWPQFYPSRGNYSDHVTFNDNAMASLLTALHHAQQGNAPFNGDIFSDTDRAQMKTAIDKGVDYILKSQWTQNDLLTVWCAQHGATDYLPKAARAYELESLSGSESVEVLGFLMTQPQTMAIETAVKAGLMWFRSNHTIAADTAYIRRPSSNSDDAYNPIVSQPDSRMWYRFYNLTTNEGFFSDRDGGTYYDIMDISAERRHGYSWGGNYGEKIINYANSVGY